MINTDTLANFLLVRLAEDEERAARWPDTTFPRADADLALEIDVKRTIILAVQNWQHLSGMGSTPECAVLAGLPCNCGVDDCRLDVLRPLATVYSDHPDFLKDWTL